MAKMKPLVFVVMPFGKKEDSSKSCEINFDFIYQRAIKPAIKSVGLDVIRADEERNGGIIHVTMFERLLIAEIVIADLTIQNANVFYELGVRHAARPRSTILIYGKENRLPFDVSLIRAIPYELLGGKLSAKNVTKLKNALIEKLKDAKKDYESYDSPLFQLIKSFPGIELPHDVTESFQDRSRYIDNIRKDLENARCLKPLSTAKRKIKAIEKKLTPFHSCHSESLIDLFLSYRDIKAWDEMIALAEKLPKPMQQTITIKEQYAFALNRRNSNNDRSKAVRILDGLIKKYGDSPETCGILGRIYKDAYDEFLKKKCIEQAAANLDESISWYRKGFESDPRDYYPGINAATLMFLRGDQDELRKLLPAVSFAVARRGGISSSDYWDVATTLEIAVLGEDWEMAERASQRLLIFQAPSWNFETTIRNLQFIANFRPNEAIEKITSKLKKKSA